MAGSMNGVVLWAIPRFHRVAGQFNRSNGDATGSLAVTANRSLAWYPTDDVLKVLSEAVAESPEAAAHLHASH